MADINYNEVTHSVVYTDGASVGAGPDPMFHWDVRFPNRISRLNLTPEFSRISLGLGLTSTVSSCLSPVGRRQNRRARAAERSGGSSGSQSAAPGRFRTQPITFDEIAEVDEDGGPAGVVGNSASPAAETSGLSTGAAGSLVLSDAISNESKVNFKTQMVSFSRSMDGLMPGYIHRAATSGAVLTGSDKENTPCEPDFVSSSPSNMAAGQPCDHDSNQPTGSGLQVAGVADELVAALAGFQMPTAIVDTGRLRRKRSNRKLRNRNSVPEEVAAEQLGTDCINTATNDIVDHDASG